MKFNLKLKQQITLIICLALLLPALIISTISVYKIYSKGEEDVAAYQDEALTSLKLYLKHITDVAYGMVHERYKEAMAYQAENPDFSIDSVMEQTLEELSRIRFDRGEGYFWITDNKIPYPTMIMHAEKRDMKGRVLNDAAYNVEKEFGKNIYQVRAELCNRHTDAFVEYVMKKPGTSEVENKISYSRLLPGLNWIISAGFYTDQISEAVALKRNAVRQQINEVILTILILGLFVMTGGLIAGLYFSGKLTTAIITIKEKLKDLGSGLQVEEVTTTRKDEVGDMTQSLNRLVKGIRSYTAFAKDIGQGNLTQSFEPLSDHDVLGNELLQMRKNLKQAADDKNIRDWVNEGLARLGDVLRTNATDTRVLADEILKELIKYLKVNQGALFLLRESHTNSTEELEQLATYAYDRKKFVNKVVSIGEGLVGQCVLEKETIHLTDIPQDYVAITSGLGGALPAALLIVPLIHNEQVFGVIELASFQKFEPHHVRFIEKIGESIASTIATVQVNERTRRLLQNSQQLSEELKAQEEELRQNQEELQATQEQMQRKQVELERENHDLRDALQHRGVPPLAKLATV